SVAEIGPEPGRPGRLNPRRWRWRWWADCAVAIEVLVEEEFRSDQARRIARRHRTARQPVAVAVGVPEHILIGRAVLPGNLIAAEIGRASCRGTWCKLAHRDGGSAEAQIGARRAADLIEEGGAEHVSAHG